ncbi:hypothetical protein JB92DRAFT_3093633 [Gautieria morchelliformis]|nr:hypothetical protein JB92DRAFT_3093633 [Gautieria morchelliformis]
MHLTKVRWVDEVPCTSLLMRFFQLLHASCMLLPSFFRRFTLLPGGAGGAGGGGLKMFPGNASIYGRGRMALLRTASMKAWCHRQCVRQSDLDKHERKCLARPQRMTVVVLDCVVTVGVSKKLGASLICTLLYQRTRHPLKEPMMPYKPHQLRDRVGEGRQMQITDNLADAHVPGAWTASNWFAWFAVKNCKAALVDMCGSSPHPT